MMDINNDLRNSDWKTYMGIVAEDKVIDSNLLKVYIPEMLPHLTGSLSDNEGDETISYIDNDTQNTISSKVKTTNVITATFFNLITNRSDIPQLRKGEQVIIFQYADTDIYLWHPTGQKDHLRRLDTYRVSVSDQPDKDKIYDEIDDAYIFEIDTLHKKTIVLKTSKADNEKYQYLIKIDSEARTIQIMDDGENEIILESDIPRIRSSNRSGTFVDLNGEDCIIGAPQDVIIKAGRQMLLKAPIGTINFDQTCSVTGAGIVLNGSNLVMSGGTVGLNGSVKIDSLVCGPVQATGYSTGGYGGCYSKPSTDLGSGSGDNPPAEPATPQSDGNRHSTAHEQIYPALQLIHDCLAQIDSQLLPLSPNYGNILTLGDESIMPQNKGE
jgi:hypothetical protein